MHCVENLTMTFVFLYFFAVNKAQIITQTRETAASVTEK